MHADIEPLVGVIRLYDGGAMYPDPYTLCCTVRWVSPTVVELIGFMRAPTPSEWGAIGESLLAHDVDEVVIVRYRDGQREERVVSTLAAAKSHRRRAAKENNHASY